LRAVVVEGESSNAAAILDVVELIEADGFKLSDLFAGCSFEFPNGAVKVSGDEGFSVRVKRQTEDFVRQLRRLADEFSVDRRENPNCGIIATDSDQLSVW